MDTELGYAFDVGQLVTHKRYSYRGVIAARDPVCRASSEWYEKNSTQPDRDQPWYYVLVHGGTHSTYVAESNLELDQGGEQVIHPVAKKLFEHFHGGRYSPRSGVRFPDLLF